MLIQEVVLLAFEVVDEAHSKWVRWYIRGFQGLEIPEAFCIFSILSPPLKLVRLSPSSGLLVPLIEFGKLQLWEPERRLHPLPIPLFINFPHMFSTLFFEYYLPAFWKFANLADSGAYDWRKSCVSSLRKDAAAIWLSHSSDVGVFFESRTYCSAEMLVFHFFYVSRFLIAVSAVLYRVGATYVTSVSFCEYESQVRRAQVTSVLHEPRVSPCHLEFRKPETLAELLLQGSCLPLNKQCFRRMNMRSINF